MDGVRATTPIPGSSVCGDEGKKKKRKEKLCALAPVEGWLDRQSVFMFPRVDNRVKVSRYGSPDTGLRSTNCQSNRERLRVSVAEKADRTGRPRGPQEFRDTIFLFGCYFSARTIYYFFRGLGSKFRLSITNVLRGKRKKEKKYPIYNSDTIDRTNQSRESWNAILFRKIDRFDEGKKARVPGKRSLITFTFVRNNASRLRMPDKMCML